MRVRQSLFLKGNSFSFVHLHYFVFATLAKSVSFGSIDIYVYIGMYYFSSLKLKRFEI